MFILVKLFLISGLNFWTWSNSTANYCKSRCSVYQGRAVRHFQNRGETLNRRDDDTHNDVPDRKYTNVLVSVRFDGAAWRLSAPIIPARAFHFFDEYEVGTARARLCVCVWRERILSSVFLDEVCRLWLLSSVHFTIVLYHVIPLYYSILPSVPR